MVYNFNWNTQPKGKNTEAIAVQYIKARYGVTPTEFAKMVIKKQASQEKTLTTETISPIAI